MYVLRKYFVSTVYVQREYCVRTVQVLIIILILEYVRTVRGVRSMLVQT